MVVGTFNYATKIKINNGDYKIVSFNTPYENAFKKKSEEDIKFVIEEQKMIDVKSLENDTYCFNFNMKFIEKDEEYQVYYLFESLEKCHKK